MKTAKKILSLFLACLMMFSVFGAAVVASAEAETITSFKINPGTDTKSTPQEDSIDTVNWYKKSNGINYMFLPSGTDLSSLTVWFEATDDVYVGETKLVSGETTDVFAEGGSYTLSAGNKSYPLYVMCSSSVPSMYITTQSGSLDYIHASKENKESGSIKIIKQDGTVDVEKALKQIKGRGNATWGCVKKPYNIKFDKKTSVLGMDKAKKWTLLANYNDASLIRNSVALDMADRLGLMYTSESQSVDLYINGNYMGNYLVCESVEVGSSRVNITDLEDANETANPGIDIEACTQSSYSANGNYTDPGSKKWVDIPNDPENITGGYLLEFEFDTRYKDEVSGFVTNQGQSVVIKSPEYASKAEVDYISDFVCQAEDAIYSETGYNSLGKHYSEYFDMESLVKMYIIQEFTMNLDAGDSSLFFYKDANSDKLVAAPVWDFDHALGEDFNRFGVSIGDASVWYANTVHYTNAVVDNVNQIPTVLSALYKHEDFRALVSAEWNSAKDILGGETTLNKIESLKAETKASAVMDAFRWNKLTSNFDYEAKSTAYDKQINIISNFVSARTTALTKGFSEDAVMLYYDSNGAKGNMFNNEIVVAGESVTVKDITVTESRLIAPDGYVFAGWNTEKDGSGISYAVGDKITLTGKTTVLYAQWKSKNASNETEDTNVNDCSCICHSKDSFKHFIYKMILIFWRIFQINKTCQCGKKHY